MTVPNGDEKRKHPRVGFTTQIRVRLETNDQTISLNGSSKDLSLKGIFIHTDGKVLDEGEHCRISVFLSGSIDEIELVMEGKVVRSAATGMGIEFASMDVDTYSHLKNIVQYNSVDHSV